LTLSCVTPFALSQAQHESRAKRGPLTVDTTDVTSREGGLLGMLGEQPIRREVIHAGGALVLPWVTSDLCPLLLEAGVRGHVTRSFCEFTVKGSRVHFFS
jgi:hypothetical protein